MSDSLEPVTAPPAPDNALAILDNAAASVAPASVQEAGAPVPTPAKKKGGFPKGAKRGPGGKKLADGAAPAEKATKPAAAAAAKVYDGTDPANQGAPALGMQQVRTPGASRMADPVLVAACKPHLKNCVLVVTTLLARMMRRPDMKATDEEAELIAETGAPVLVLHMPDVAEATPEGALSLAVLNYGAPRMLALTSKGGVPSGPAEPVAVAVAPPPAAPVDPPYPGLAQTGE